MKLPARQTVLLGDVPVGSLGVEADGSTEFRFLPTYAAATRRPVLGQAFLDDPGQVHRARTRLPPWFANLLPEGALRQLLSGRADEAHDYHLLHRLRDDLPGNVRLRDAGDGAEIDIDRVTPPLAGEDVESDGYAPRWKFSLAGVQLKFSAQRHARGLTVPVSGQGGDWIVKLPDPQHAGVPAVEHATMAWAQAAGIDVPAFDLVELAEVAGLDGVSLPPGERHAFAIRRFDRSAGGGRIHMEDFAQVLDVYPERKYSATNVESLARIVHAVAGWRGLAALLRRVVFNIAAGNGDAHLKNWSLLYPDGVSAELSPAYDLVSTIQFIDGDRLALNLGGSKVWSDVGMASFRRLASKIGDVDDRAVIAEIEAGVEAVRAAWRTHGDGFGFDAEQRRRLDRHMASVPLLR